MVQRGRDLAGDTALSARQTVQITLGLAHVMTAQVARTLASVLCATAAAVPLAVLRIRAAWNCMSLMVLYIST